MSLLVAVAVAGHAQVEVARVDLELVLGFPLLLEVTIQLPLVLEGRQALVQVLQPMALTQYLAQSPLLAGVKAQMAMVQEAMAVLAAAGQQVLDLEALAILQRRLLLKDQTEALAALAALGSMVAVAVAVLLR